MRSECLPCLRRAGVALGALGARRLGMAGSTVSLHQGGACALGIGIVCCCPGAMSQQGLRCEHCLVAVLQRGEMLYSTLSRLRLAVYEANRSSTGCPLQ